MGSLVTISALKESKPESMLKAASHLSDPIIDALFHDIVLPEIPPRDIFTLMHLLNTEQGHLISLLEWTNIFKAHNYFEKLSWEEVNKYQAVIWQHILKSPQVRHLAMWRICLCADGQSEMMPNRIAVRFDDYYPKLKSIDKQRAMVVKAVIHSRTMEVANYSLQIGLRPSKLLSRFGLPFRISIADFAHEDLESCLAKKGYKSYADRYLKILECYSDNERDAAITRLIEHSDADGLEQAVGIIKYLKKHYGPTTLNSRWAKLSLSTQNKLREYLGSAWFAEFKEFVFKLTSAELAKALDLNETDIRQLRSRVTFWSNYQSRFYSFKVFLPLKTSKIIENFGLHLPDHAIVDGFKHARDETELCLLEFDEYIVVEYLRGGSSSLKVYPKTEYLACSLLTVGKLNIDTLEQIKFIEEHDHLIFWQHSCEKMLRSELGILPDQKITKFMIQEQTKNKDSFYLKYNISTGLPSLSKEKVMKRYDAISKRQEENRARGINSNNKKIKMRGIKPNSYYVGQILWWRGKHLVHVTNVGETSIMARFEDGKNIQMSKINDFIEFG